MTDTVQIRTFDDEIHSCMEHLQQVRVSMRLQRTKDFKPKIGTPAYHLDAAEDYLQRAFQLRCKERGEGE